MSQTDYEVLVIGAGVAGICQIKKLKDMGVTALVLEASDGLGGTWYNNRYPAAGLTAKATLTALNFRAICSMNGTGKRCSLRSRKI